MAVTNSLSSKRFKFIRQLKHDFPQFKFLPGQKDFWSAHTNTITYAQKIEDKNFSWSILHELAHALLGHITYGSDFELIKMESLAWQKAAELGQKYNIKISDDHIQDCMDTYREWLHRRSACPVCGSRSPQLDAQNYKCLNCSTEWSVTQNLARPYRLKSQKLKD